MKNNVSENKSPFKFFLLVLLLSIPFWILGAVTRDLTEIIPIKLPISALMTFCPLLAAAILVYKEQEVQGIKELLKLSFDFQKIKDKKWYIPIVLLMPTIAALSYLYLKITGAILPEPPIPFLSVIIFFFVYFIGAIGEEVGWSGYVTDPLQNQYGAFKASIIIGSIWAVWHIIPYSQAHQTPIWIFWQCLGTVFLRIIMVWIFNNANKSVFALILFHTTINISPYLFPSNGSHYDPFVFAILLAITAIAITWLWGTETLGKYRFLVQSVRGET
ncbi:CAAX amino terminal protease family protein [Pseudanabaena sp. lw0831]|uniref:CPBP family intramembrane glutamic endopeptidase n=1 Tax=Pseudanabaena sp. lw0831 TaxID=1357935 RepID=UPI001916C5B9|nr:CPBP family intramembrane glutamic endopeptidase [Pseudanabaena sp. lw0831]GBO51870.1 CAAX amino terminal protease family protein [Pseudanabaena sp. lw0831]